ncbi:MAG: GtrA family protein [Pseudomonas sp.]|uniref:GtrA family protein n=1 Tax=Pseudomonas sp. TaxID=306 RepID=UPI003D6FD359
MHFKLGLTNGTLVQLIKYGIIGISTNTAGYLLYLAATYIGITPIWSMTLLYALGASIGFVSNRRITFAYEGGIFGSGIRYVLVHLAGYALNFGILIIFVDRLGYPHQIIQVFAIFTVAAFLFIMFKFFVFRSFQK